MKRHSLAALFLFSASIAVAPAQTVQTNGAEAPPEEVVEMTPFVVTSVSDQGYTATMTEAGSRLGSKLLDTPSPITIMTAEFLEDIGALNIDDALNYGLNTEMHTETDDEGYRIRGIRSRSYGRNNFVRSVGPPNDSYNTDRATVSRGPNSILFGNADPSGVVNVTTKTPNISRNRYEMAMRFDEENAWRVTADINHVIVPKRVALRVDALNQDQKGFRKPARDEWKAFYVAGSAVIIDKPNYNLTLRFDYEQMHRTRNRARVDVITESVTYWESLGRITAPYGNGVTDTASTPAGARRESANYLVHVGQSLVPVPVLNWKNTARGLKTPNSDTYGLPASEELWPMYINSQGLNAALDDEKQRYRTIYLEQRIGKNFHLQFAYNDYKYHQWRTWNGTGFTELRVDVNEQLPSRSGGKDVNAPYNPNVGQYYFEKQMQPSEWVRDESTFRVSATYELDLRKLNQWLGLHHLVGSYDKREATRYTTYYKEVNLTPLGGYSASLAAAENRIYRRHYVYRGQGIYTVGANFDPIAEGRGGINSGFARLDVPAAEKNEAESLFGAVQSFWLKGRLVTIAGIRHDKSEFYERLLGSGYNPVTEMYTPATESIMVSMGADTNEAITTTSFGAVLHVAKWLSLFCNFSDNYSPSTTKRDVNGDLIPVSVGKGQDAGVKFQFFGGKLAGSLGVYKNAKENDGGRSLEGLTDVGDAIDDIWDIIGEPGNSTRRRGGGYGKFGYTQSYEAKGAELELIFNPTRNWRISLTGAYNDTVYSKQAPEYDRYLGKYMTEWRTKGDMANSSGKTITQFLDADLVPAHQIVKSQEGKSGNLIRPWTGTLVTRYRFSQPSWLRGFAIGGALRFRDHAVIGYANNPDGTLNLDSKYFGGYIWSTDAFISYERTFFKKRIKWKSQLGVRNILDNTDPVTVKRMPDGTLSRLQVVQPRTFTWTNTFSF